MDIKADGIQTMTNIPDCMTIPQIQQATAQDDHLKLLKGYIIIGWPENKDQVPQEMRMYWTIQDHMVVIEGIMMKGRYVVIPKILKMQALDQLHVKHVGKEKTKFLAHESVC